VELPFRPVDAANRDKTLDAFAWPSRAATSWDFSAPRLVSSNRRRSHSARV